MHVEPASRRFWTEDVTVELVIDLPALAKYFAEKAIKSKTLRSTALAGKIRCKVVNQREYDVTVIDLPVPHGFVEVVK